eukprot:c23469_g1_i2 orf=185-496(+)
MPLLSTIAKAACFFCFCSLSALSHPSSGFHVHHLHCSSLSAFDFIFPSAVGHLRSLLICCCFCSDCFLFPVFFSVILVAFIFITCIDLHNQPLISSCHLLLAL